MLQLPVALTLMGLCVAIHAAGVISAMQWLRRRPRDAPILAEHAALRVRLRLDCTVAPRRDLVVGGVLSVAERDAHLASALDFSAVTYTTTGYGDLVLAEGRRLLGAVEALTGILMCGWSTGFFFAIVNRLYEVVPGADHETDHRPRRDQ